MGFEGLLGNDRLKDNLRRSISRGRISHFYLISGPAGAGKRTLAKILAAAILCSGKNKPCGTCAHCRKVMNNNHPDFITIDDPEKKTVPVDLIRQARTDIYVRPNEAEHKVYLFPRGQDIAIPGQNALLKILEEPPAYGVFLLLTDNPEKLLPTVRSRCVELSLHGLPEALLRDTLTRRYPQAAPELINAAVSRSGGFLGQAVAIVEDGSNLPPQVEAFLRAYSAHSTYDLLSVLVPMEKWKRDQLIPVLEQWISCLEGALSFRSGLATASPMAKEVCSARSAQSLMSAIRHLQKAVEYAKGNVSVAAICGYLIWVLR